METKEMIFLIPCTNPCLYQRNGACTLRDLGTPSSRCGLEGNDCLYFTQRPEKKHSSRKSGGTITG
ncbi:MAG: hypothetical protein ACOX7F_03495 [Eubacteriales bacterium]